MTPKRWYAIIPGAGEKEQQDIYHPGGVPMGQHPNGEFVLWDDYASLKAELTDLKSEADYLKAEVASLRKELADAQENYHLVNETVVRLRKEGHQS